ncbi:MAG: PD-(D/E)XK nuclease family protein [Endomicrobium sp.]|jgi:CRISPR/Cas system-associated exonuclease Cas4 (RecB family)|nr:PD-(D/E)XK nuclease family protein [Endomicrobium sp.]
MKYSFKISYSRINTYLFCPYKYKFVYLDNIRTPANPDVTFGHIIHKSLEKFHYNNKYSRNILFTCYNNSWRNDGFISSQQIFEYYKRGERLLENYYKTFCKSKTEILYVEKAFNTNIREYKFIGIIDRIDKHIDGAYEIIDYKTHLKIWNQEKIDKDLQLSLYAYAYKNIFGFYPDKISIYFLSWDEKIYTKRSEKMILDAMNVAIEAAKNIISENFKPDTSKCTICDFKFICQYSEYRTNKK